MNFLLIQAPKDTFGQIIKKKKEETFGQGGCLGWDLWVFVMLIESKFTSIQF
jgi:hypothetical protein